MDFQFWWYMKNKKKTIFFCENKIAGGVFTKNKSFSMRLNDRFNYFFITINNIFF